MTSRIISSPVVHNGVVYITNEASKVYAFSADGIGRRIWSDEPGQPHDYTALALPIDIHGIGADKQNICGASSPAIATVNGTNYLIVGCDDGYLYRINLSNGSRSIAELNMDACVESSPSVSGNNAYIGTSIYGGESVYRVSIEPFEQRTRWALGEESRATVSLEYDYAFNGVDTGHQFHKLDAFVTGLSIEAIDSFGSVPPEGYFVGSAGHTTGGVIYTGNDNGRFYILNANDLKHPYGYFDMYVQEQDFICSSPAISYNVDGDHNRWIFITTRSDNGKLYAFKTIKN